MGSDIVNIVAGTAGGAAQVVIGQPFDIVKVRLQTNGGNAFTVARNIWIKEGALAFYKGSLPPLLGLGICGSIQFGAFHSLCNILKMQPNRGSRNLSLAELYLAGGGAGLANSVLSGPIEHIRIRLQTQPDGEKRLYKGPKDCFQRIFNESGIRGIYRGQGITMLREFHGFGIWFGAYESLANIAAEMDQKTRAELPSWKVAVCGGFAGEIMWLLCHPLDVIKSKMQSDGFGKSQRYRTTQEAFKMTWRIQGISGFFEGLLPNLLRAMPVSAGIFATVEVIRKVLG